MLLTFVSRVLAFDLAWIISLVLDNLVLLFILASATYFFFNKENLVRNFFVVLFILWAERDFVLMSGWGIYSASFLLLLYTTRMALIVLVENSKALSKHLVGIYLIHWVILFSFYNIFMVR